MKPFRAAIFAAALALASAASAGAQGIVSMGINGIETSAFPVIKLSVSLSTGGFDQRELSPANFGIFENGVSQQIESVICPGDSSTRFSIAVLLDRSSSMARLETGGHDPDSAKLRAAKLGAAALFGMLGSRDEACLYSFASDYGSAAAFTSHCDYTAEISSLVEGLSSINAEGGTWIWSALLRTIDSLQTRPGRAMLVCLTDGRSRGENPLFHSAEAVINSARRARVPIYFIGLGRDVDERILQNVSSASGGRYFRSPTADDLIAAFSRLAEEELVDACMLRYTSTNPCLDGSLRIIELAMRIPGNYLETDTAYAVAYREQTTTLSFESRVETPSKGIVRVPVYLDKALSISLPLSCDIGIRYEPSLMRFLRIETQGAILSGATHIVESSEGSCRVAVASHVPYVGTGTLFALVFESLGVTTDSVTWISFGSSSLTQHCLKAAAGEAMELLLIACVETRRLEGVALPARAGEPHKVSLRLVPPLTEGETARISFVLTLDPAVLEYAGYETAGALAECCATVLTAVKNTISIGIYGQACAVDEVVRLLFRTRSERSSVMTFLRIAEADVKTRCANAVSTSETPIISDGYCEPMLGRKEQFRLRNYPNPATDISVFAFTLQEAGYAILRILDCNGREAARALDASLAKGEHTVRANVASIPPGVYAAVLSVAGRSESTHFHVIR